MASSLHRELGKPESMQVTHEFFQKLIELGIREQTDLDFKRFAYHPMNDKDKRELAKDVCAMANSGGGWILCGIEEKDEVAVGFSGMEVTARTETAIHELIENQIEPSLRIQTRVYANDAGEDYVLAIRVPDSAEKPHILHASLDHDSTHSFVVPVRDGARTRWLSERDLRAMYLSASEKQSKVKEEWDSLLDDAISHSARYKGTCLVVAASLTRPTEAAPIENEKIRSLLARDSRRQYILSQIAWNYFDDYCYTVSVGDRRKIVRYGGRKGEMRIDFLDNGSIEAFVQLGGLTDDERSAQHHPVAQPSHVRNIDVEAALAQLIDLIDVATSTHAESDVKLSVRLEYGGVEPILIRKMYPRSDLIQSESESIPIQRFRTVSYILPAQRSSAEVSIALFQIATEVLNQGEIASPWYLVRPE